MNKFDFEPHPCLEECTKQNLTKPYIQPVFSCTIPGRAYVKKNNQRAIGNGRRKRIIYTPQYVAWEMEAIRWMRVDAGIQQHKTFTKRCNLKAIFFFKNHQAEPDLSALYEGVQDVLQKVGVIANDKLIYSHNGSTKVFGETARTEIKLWEIE